MDWVHLIIRIYKKLKDFESIFTTFGLILRGVQSF
jgi:hypothetical protein